ncbi:MAG TPA: ribose 5-phosphate isomerase B [bacterium]
MKKIAIASDHAGFELKEKIKEFLKAQGYEVLDLGTNNTESVDYPDYAAMLAEKISAGELKEGVLCCGTGIGMSIAANKFPGVRAAVAVNEFMAQMAREHNDANVLCLSSRVTDPEIAKKLVDVWLNAKFEGGRHDRRVKKIIEIEKKER